MLPHNGKMKEYGLIGHPLGHSFSRKFFTEKFLNEGLDATYLNFDIPKVEMLKDVVLGHPNLQGLNCTIPYKESVIPLLDEISPLAQEVGAVNVIKILRSNDFVGGKTGNGIKLVGYNSDVIGFANSISPLLRPHHRKALILGSGGAAKAVRVALERMGVGCTNVSRKSASGFLTYDEITPEKMQEFQILVNCTPVGMFPHVNEAPSLPYESLSACHLLFDLIYNPDATLFLKRGAEAGATVKNGLEMLELQAKASWGIWKEDK